MIEFQAEKVRSSLYDLNWEDYDVATRKMVLLMVLASTPNRTLKMGNIFALNMENFARVGDMNMSDHGWEMDTYKFFSLAVRQSLLLFVRRTPSDLNAPGYKLEFPIHNSPLFYIEMSYLDVSLGIFPFCS